MPDMMQCPECGEWFNPAYLDQVAKHMHAGIEINETIKGVKVNQVQCVTHEFVEVEVTVTGQPSYTTYQCKHCGVTM